MLQLDTIILANTKDQGSFEMNLNCIQSLLDSEMGSNPELKIRILLLESNAGAAAQNWAYPEQVEVIIPDFPFNFNRFLNLGISKSTGDFIALCNNDLIFEKNWFSEIMKVKQESRSRSFCPLDPDGPFVNAQDLQGLSFQMGYAVRKHIAGWCIVMDADLPKKIGELDEDFDFYYADDDYGMTLRKFDIPHALVCKSHVRHLGGKSSGEIAKKKVEVPEGLPKWLSQPSYQWILANEKMLHGHLAFHKKWGSPKKIALKNRIAKILKALGLKSGWLY